MTSRIHFVSMTADQTVGAGSWTEVYSLSGDRPLLHRFVIHLNTDKMLLRLTLDTTEVTVDVDLEELVKGFKFNKLTNSVLTNYNSKRWAFQPPNPQWTNTGFKIELRSKSGNKTLERGLVIWGEA